MRVLVAEDDPAITELLTQAITDRLPASVTPVANGALVLDALVPERPDLLILDISLPGLNGVDVYDLVRNDERWRDVPILFLTAYPERTPDVARTTAAHEVMTKPFDIDDLVARVDRLLRGDRPAAA